MRASIGPVHYVASRLRLPHLSLAVCLASAAQASPIVLNDSYTLSTTGRNVYTSGAEQAWIYHSGFQGARYGSFANQAPAGFGFNAIAGNENECVLLVCVDTRTGAAAQFSSSGQVGVEVAARASGGSVSATLPFSTTLSLTVDPSTGRVHVGGDSGLKPSAQVKVAAPNFAAGVDGILNVDSSLALTGCIIFAGCTSSNTPFNIDPGRFGLIGFDTSKDTPLDAFGVPFKVKFGSDIDFRKSVAGVAFCDVDGACFDASGFKVALGGPLLASARVDRPNDFASSGVNSLGQIDASSNSTVFTMTADIPGIAQAVLGFPFDVLNPLLSIDLKVATLSLSGSLVDASVGVNLGFGQRVSFDPTLLATLEFDTDVIQNGINLGRFITVDVDAGSDFEFAGAVGKLLSRTYSIADRADFTSESSLTIDPLIAFSAGCVDIELSFPRVGTGPQCAFSRSFATTGLLEVPVYSQQFSLGGFGAQRYAQAIDLSTAIPEPHSALLVMAALAGLGRFSRRPKRVDRQAH